MSFLSRADTRGPDCFCEVLPGGGFGGNSLILMGGLAGAAVVMDASRDWDVAFTLGEMPLPSVDVG